MSRKPTDDSKTGTEIAETILASHLGNERAKSLVQEMRGHKYALVILQEGNLSQLLDAADQLTAENAQLRQLVYSIRSELLDKTGEAFPERVLEFCTSSKTKGDSTLTTAQNAQRKFSALDELYLSAIEQSGGSVQMRLTGGSYIVFAEGEDSWSIRDAPLF